MGEGGAEGRVAVSGRVGGVAVSLVVGAVVAAAGDRLSVRRAELGVDVDAGVNMRQVPRDALATVLSEVTVAVLGEDHTGGDATVVADETAVAVAGSAVGTVAIAASATPSADTKLVVIDGERGAALRAEAGAVGDRRVGLAVGGLANSGPDG